MQALLAPPFLHYAAGSASKSSSEAAEAVKRNTRIGPAAKHLLLVNGLSAEDVTPTGPHGIVTKGDVLAALEGGAKPKPRQQPAPEGQQQNLAGSKVQFSASWALQMQQSI